MALVILFGVYIILGFALTVSIFKNEDFPHITCSQYVIVGIISTVMWLPWVIESNIRHAKRRKNS